MKKRILGLDTGSNSLGWAVVDRHEDGNYSLVDKGVLIFQEGVKNEKGIESSKAAERTFHRAQRRQYFRRRLRKIQVLKVLIKYNLCPSLTEEDLKLWHSRKIYPLKDDFILWQRTNERDDVNPYHSRYVCLTEALDLRREVDRYTLGRAMYHLAQRRGFMSNRLDANEDSESGAVKAGIAGLTKEMADAGCLFLGEYFYKMYREYGNKVRIRTRYTDREQHYKAEFYAICEKQGISDEMRKELERALYFQRPLKSQRQSVGRCTFEKKKTRCSDSHPLFEEFRMLSFLNNIRIQGPDDLKLRQLNETEISKIKSLFYRTSKLDFETIAKKIAGKGNYQYIKDAVDKPYKFNYRMSQEIVTCPTTAQLMKIFGDDWTNTIAETFDLNQHKDGSFKSAEEMACDVWNVLYFFDSKEKLKEYGMAHLQLDETQAERFSKIRLSRDFSSLSLKAIRNILPFLRMGMLYSHAVFMGKVPDLVGPDVWNDNEQRAYILEQVSRMTATPCSNIRGQHFGTLDICIKDFLREEYNIVPQLLDSLYHPSMIETYRDACPNKDGLILLGSPRTDAVRNPMAIRSLHKIRLVVNSLIREGMVTPDTEVHVEYARSLNNANMRAAINDRQRDLEKKHKQYAEELKRIYKDVTSRDIEPNEKDVLKFQLWEEQNHVCPYTGKEIAISDFIGAGPVFDIEHTIPRCVGGDSTQENMTLCDSHFNRYVKKSSLPTELPNYEDILVRVAPWKEKIEILTRQIDKISTRGIWEKKTKDGLIRKKNRLKMERDYWRGKYQRFTMTEVPEGFALRQGAGIGLISKYAALYLQSYFHDVANPERRQVYSIKGPITAEFRKMWGIQSEYEKKSRDSHTHHCIDAIVIACIGKHEINQMGHYHRAMMEHDYEGKAKPQFPKPWPSFTQDLKQISVELPVVHDTSDNMSKKACRKIDTLRGRKQAKGDCARGSLHLDTYYGAIEQDGTVKYVVRRSLDNKFKRADVDKIVDKVVREKVRNAFEGNTLRLPVYMNEEKAIIIKKVRCYASFRNPLHIRYHRDKSDKVYKQQYHVVNDTNYCMAIYEGVVKGKAKRDYEIVNNIDAAAYYKKSADFRKNRIVPEKNAGGLNLKYTLFVGMHVILYETSKDEIRGLSTGELCRRLYTITGISYKSLTIKGKTYRYGLVTLKFHNEARQSTELSEKNGVYKQNEMHRPLINLNHNQFHALVEGVDFEITPLGKIKMK